MSDFSSQGVIMHTHETKASRKIDQMYNFSPNIRVGHVDFVPDGRISKNSTKTSLWQNK